MASRGALRRCLSPGLPRLLHLSRGLA
uniref:PRKCH upstream open reading frame 2 n=1 Tax=Homo sapiens TaxID=9606 RepID=PKHUO_HUMAN|nr:RecName: Full=PRKCH upstream open reading frame 2; Short=uORF2; AltName: Full=Protein uPEP2 [Homo sapiens]